MFKFLFLAAVPLAIATPAAAEVITSLPGGTALVIPSTNQLGFAGPATIAPGITYSSNLPSAYGYTGGYGFNSNGSWNGVPMIGLDSSAGSFQIAFATPIKAFLGELNWGTGSIGNASIAAYDSVGGLLESLTLENGSNIVAPGFYGFSRDSAEIASIRFSNEYIGVRNITLGGAVPEPATWALMIAGFGMVGAAARRRRVSSVPA